VSNRFVPLEDLDSHMHINRGLETITENIISENKDITDLYRRIDEFMWGYQLINIYKHIREGQER
jgi:hypothetical protein